jgi:zinc/manganese transport system substrate-binding protein
LLSEDDDGAEDLTKLNGWKMKKLIALFITVVFFSPPAHAANNPLQVVTTFTSLADMAKTVGGNAVDVTTLVGPESDVHTYKPTAEDARKLAAADLILMNGLGLEPWMPQLVAASSTKARIVIVGDNLKTRVMKSLKGVPDPHAWQNVANGRIYASTIATVLEQMLPVAAKTIQMRASSYDATLNQMDSYIRTQLATIPRAKRKIVTSHEAFDYFGAAYGVTFLAPVGTSTDVEPSSVNITNLILEMKREGIKIIFAENVVTTGILQQIATATSARISGMLLSDSLSTATGSAPTYLAMFRNNVALMKPAMQMSKP